MLDNTLTQALLLKAAWILWQTMMHRFNAGELPQFVQVTSFSRLLGDRCTRIDLDGLEL
jgi:hypothetical protein